MPPHQSMLARLNEHTTQESILRLQKKHRKPADILAQLRKLTLTGTDDKKVLDAWPQGLRSALEAVVLDNVGREKPLLMQWAWKPAYDYELSIYETPASAISEGGITLILGSRYPLDEHPVDIGMPASKVSAPTKLARTFRRAAFMRRNKAKHAAKKGK